MGFESDLSKPHFQTISELFKLRDALAHGRTQNLTIKKADDGRSPHDVVQSLLPWEQLTAEMVRKSHDDVRAAVEFINTTRKKPDQFLWNQGARGFATR
jgi:hypothetical protein